MYQRGTGDNCDKCHLSSGQEKSTSNKGDVIVAFKRHALNLIPSRPTGGKACEFCRNFCLASIMGT